MRTTCSLVIVIALTFAASHHCTMIRDRGVRNRLLRVGFARLSPNIVSLLTIMLTCVSCVRVNAKRVLV